MLLFFSVFPRFSFRLRQTGFQAGLGRAPGLAGLGWAPGLAGWLWVPILTPMVAEIFLFCYGLKWGASGFLVFVLFSRGFLID